MPPSPRRRTTTRATRSNQARHSTTQTTNDTSPAAKRPRRQTKRTRGSTTNDDSASTRVEDQGDHLPTPSATQDQRQTPDDVDISMITLQNYQTFQDSWPIPRIQDQLKKQSSSNHQISAAVLAEGLAVLGKMDHTLHMIALASGVCVNNLKRSLGLLGGTHGENPWHRWLSFALAANDYPMPPRGHPEASELLAIRNKANSDTYNALTVTEREVFTAQVFYALGGYPDYSSVTTSEETDSFGDPVILIPEITKLSHEDELRYRPIYEDLVDMKKVARDRELNTPAAASQKQEKRSLQSFRKIAQQLSRDHQLFGLDYYIIACSSTSAGHGWCREYTSRDEISDWVSKKADLQQIFPIYCQNGSTIDEVRAVAAANAAAKSGTETQKSSNNQSDKDKKDLTLKLKTLLVNVLGKDAPPFPRIADPIGAIKDRKIDVIVERASDSALSNEDFNKGFLGMSAKARRNWMSNIDKGKFMIKKGQSPGNAPQDHHLNAQGPNGDSHGATANPNGGNNNSQRPESDSNSNNNSENNPNSNNNAENNPNSCNNLHGPENNPNGGVSNPNAANGASGNNSCQLV
ncbi:uncharacterized protein MELLADRAFT_71251 [Melampsora larici-populina 98AG31]|uniref:Uncharacterized protein n=1 Tax=Melampsora larici-populina (strain 98AG31 / pathotype 3-4-7) TaxID=747676 RepID=F4RE20_MELLP|nr:uncharacterized protein MELLADRAFT_71251 [Melampsora larici-populina 98AG31]EGG09517.1 hypothetical protein MELLADRAFT_71251 [Melampsora larici-populina 98AG31]